MADLGELLSNRFEGTTRLKEGIVLKDLIEKFNSEFTLDASQYNTESERETRIDKIFEYEEFAPYINLDCIEGSDPTGTPFEQLKKKMKPITEDGKLHKFIIRHGSGEIIPPSCIVYYHYNSYLELEEVPFDSSYLRHHKPLRMHLGIDGFYEGFRRSLMSMKVGEKSQFLVHPSYAFGRIGVPPRIPPNSTILLEIELFKFVDCGAALHELSQEEKEKFTECYNRAKACHALGNDLFQQKKLSAAIQNYKKAEKSLLQCKTTNDDEEEQWEQLLFKVYINMCVIYNKNNKPAKVLLTAKEAFYKCTKLSRKSSKLFYSVGKAHMALNDFEKAKKNLRKAYFLEPNNKEINLLLRELEVKMKKYLSEEKLACQKIFGFKAPEKDINLEDPDDEMSNVLRQEVAKFSSSGFNRLQLPTGLTQKEENLIRKLSEEVGLTVEKTIIRGRKHIAILK